ncbi:hypothetical protein P154DRAFT_535430 [Amniculicola lignicola CBS 123094]|uniref:Uncharacterized protein n=1 Tax=Amniculicola lignicola CBS 123094 TaxID=1392246 RepID=A0A6A5WFY3_9PLEO|nr:hypothetical protein P154DRAFT_535430 [Amniculicola lignicola CBS 123094]
MKRLASEADPDVLPERELKVGKKSKAQAPGRRASKVDASAAIAATASVTLNPAEDEPHGGEVQDMFAEGLATGGSSSSEKKKIKASDYFAMKKKQRKAVGIPALRGFNHFLTPSKAAAAPNATNRVSDADAAYQAGPSTSDTTRNNDLRGDTAAQIDSPQSMLCAAVLAPEFGQAGSLQATPADTPGTSPKLDCIGAENICIQQASGPNLQFGDRGVQEVAAEVTGELCHLRHDRKEENDGKRHNSIYLRDKIFRYHDRDRYELMSLEVLQHQLELRGIAHRNQLKDVLVEAMDRNDRDYRKRVRELQDGGYSNEVMRSLTRKYGVTVLAAGQAEQWALVNGLSAWKSGVETDGWLRKEVEEDALDKFIPKSSKKVIQPSKGTPPAKTINNGEFVKERKTGKAAVESTTNPPKAAVKNNIAGKTNNNVGKAKVPGMKITKSSGGKASNRRMLASKDPNPTIARYDPSASTDFDLLNEKVMATPNKKALAIEVPHTKIVNATTQQPGTIAQKEEDAVKKRIMRHRTAGKARQPVVGSVKNTNTTLPAPSDRGQRQSRRISGAPPEMTALDDIISGNNVRAEVDEDGDSVMSDADSIVEFDDFIVVDVPQPKKKGRRTTSGDLANREAMRLFKC